MSYRINTEEYYQRFIDLQEKLRKSEEERLKLEIRLNKMMQIIQTEEQRHYDNLSSQYKQFREEDKNRQDRNNYILRILDRVENQSEALEEKARRLSMIRDQYYGMPRRHYEDTRPNYSNQQFYDNDSYNLSPERDTYSAINMKEYNMNKNFNLQHQEKMEYLNKYLETIDCSKSNENKSPRSYRSSKSPISNLKLDDLKTGTPDLGYKTENFLTNRYSYQKFNDGFDDDKDSITSSPNESPRYRSRSKSPKPTAKFIDTQHLEASYYPDFNANARLSRYPRKIDRRKKQVPKKLFSADYKNSLEKLQRIQENSRKILSQHIPKPNYYRNPNIDYDRRPILSYQNDLHWNYPVASDFGLNINDMYQPDKVIQKYLIEKYNTYFFDRYPPPNPFDSYHDRLMYSNLSPRRVHRHDYNQNLPHRYNSPSSAPNDYYTYPTSPRNYVSNGDIPRYNKLDEHYSKLPKSNYISDNAPNLQKTENLRKDEKAQGIHFNDNDEILEYDRNKPSSEYNKKYELNKNWKHDDILSNNHENKLKCTEDSDKNKDKCSLNKDTLQMNGSISPISTYSDNIDASVRSETPTGQEETDIKNYNIDIVDVPSKVSDKVTIPIDNDSKDNELHLETDAPKETITPKEKYTKPSAVEKENDDSKVDTTSSQNDTNNQVNGFITPDSPELIKSTLNEEDIIVDKQTDEKPEKTSQVHEENKVPDLSTQEEYNESQMYDANSQPIPYDNDQEIAFDESAQPNQYVQNGQYDQNAEQLQYNQDGQANQYDENGQPFVQYDENGQPIQYDENGQPIQYDANGQPIQYDANGQPIQYDLNGQMIQYDENGQPIQYDANGQPIQYDQNGQMIQYDENGQPIQYDENGQPLQYDENGIPVHYDALGQPIQYSESGEELPYDPNVQPIQYDESGQPIGYAENNYGQVDDAASVNPDMAEPKTDEVIKPNVFEMLDTDTESVKQDTKVSNDSDFDVTT